MTASVGNLSLTVSKEKLLSVFNISLWINFWTYGFGAIALFVLFDPFIDIWIGHEFIMDTNTVLLICIIFYLNGMRQSVQNYRSAVGIYWQDKMKPIIEAIINLVSSIIFAKWLGTFGVFLGTFVSVLAVTIWWEPHTLYKHGFDASMKHYYAAYVQYGIMTFLAGALTVWAASQFDIGGVAEVLVKAVIVVVVPNVMFLAFSFRKSEFKSFLDMFLNMIKSKKG